MAIQTKQEGITQEYVFMETKLSLWNVSEQIAPQKEPKP
jgi:hypothetical protein